MKLILADTKNKYLKYCEENNMDPEKSKHIMKKKDLIGIGYFRKDIIIVYPYESGLFQLIQQTREYARN